MILAGMNDDELVRSHEEDGTVIPPLSILEGDRV
jgi:hypothetical protein